MFDGLMVQLRGGLGNQMFQYAAARAAALDLGVPLGLDVSALENVPAGDTAREFQLNRLAITAKLASPAQIVDPSLRNVYERGFQFHPAIRTVAAGERLIGYFQSAMYFAHRAPAIRKEFALRSAPSRERAELRERIAAAPAAVAVHVRDYALEGRVTASHHGFCPPSYYERARRVLEGMLGAAPTYFVFTDNPDTALARLGPLLDAEIVTGGEDLPWEDLHLFAACRAQIIANSSFSWWGAWLSSSDDPLVVAPRHWFGRTTLQPANTIDLLPEGWIAL